MNYYTFKIIVKDASQEMLNYYYFRTPYGKEYVSKFIKKLGDKKYNAVSSLRAIYNEFEILDYHRKEVDDVYEIREWN